MSESDNAARALGVMRETDGWAVVMKAVEVAARGLAARETGGWKKKPREVDNERETGGWRVAPPSGGPLTFWPDMLPGWKNQLPPPGAGGWSAHSFAEALWDHGMLANDTAIAIAAALDWPALKAEADTQLAAANPAAELAALEACAATHTPGDTAFEARMNEVWAQNDDVSHYVARLLACSPDMRPHTFRMVLVAIQLGAIVATRLKRQIKRARPLQVYPHLSPVLPTPRHPAFPGGHALEAYCMAAFVCEALGKVAGDLAKSLAAQIANNREWALLHFQSDTVASVALATRIMEQIQNLDPNNDAAKLFAAMKSESAKEYT